MSVSPKFFSTDNLISGVITGLINGLIAYFHIETGGSIPITVDQISTTQLTAFSQGVTTAFTLGVISTLITSKVFGKKISKTSPALAHLVQRPLFPDVMVIAINNAIFMFGWFVIISILWQRAFGSLELDRTSGACLIGLFAAIITMTVSYRTESVLLKS